MTLLHASLLLAGALVLALPAAAGAADLTLASGGSSRYRIVVPEKPGPAVTYAAEELGRYVREVSGVALAIVPESRAGRGPALLVGPSRRAKAGRRDALAAKLGPDGVLVRTVGRDVVLLGGGDRGQLYAVYTFLQRWLGVRFLAHDCTVTPRQDVVTVPPIDHAYAPPFIYREALNGDMADWAFAARMRLNGANMPQVHGPWKSPEVIPGIVIYPFVHSAAAINPPGALGATHPEYFGLVKGQRRAAVISGQPCWTNPDVRRICLEHALRWVEEQPGITSVDISQNDAWPGDWGACECDACAAIVKEEDAQHGPILRLVNAIADEVARKRPGVYVDTLAYQYTLAPPRVTRPRPNVIIRLCHDSCYFHGVTCDPLGAGYRKAIDGWHEVTRNIWVWHYGTNFWHYLAPNPNLAGLAADIKYYAAHGVNGLMLQSNIQSTGGELSDLRHYLAAQLLWDPAQDPMALRTEFCRGYYREAAEGVMAFLAQMDRLAETNGQHRPMNGWHPPEISPAPFVAEAQRTLQKALAAAPDDVVRGRVEKLMLPLWYVQLSWPDLYGLSKEAGRSMVAEFAGVIRAHGITTIAEGPPNAEAFIERMTAAYSAPR